MPLGNEHACRIRPDADFEPGSLKRVDVDVEKDLPVGIVTGRLPGEMGAPISEFRYPANRWSEAAAASHCQSMGGAFEIAGIAAEPGDAVQADSSVDDDGPTFPGPEPNPRPRHPGDITGNVEVSNGDVNQTASARGGRRFHAGTVELEVRSDGGPPAISGYAAVFYDGTPATEFRLWDDLIERILPGAFDRMIREKQDVVALSNHDKNRVLGRRSNGSLSLTTDRRGLRYRLTPPADTTAVRDTVADLRAGNVTGSSFSFDVGKGGRNFVEDEKRGVEVVELVDIERVGDVGPVTFPAYSATTAELDAIRSEIRSGRQLRQRLTEYARRAKIV